MGNNNGIAIFDVDDTLINGQSQKIFIDYLFRKKLISFWVYTKIIIWFSLYKIGLVADPKSIAEYSFKLFKNKSEEEINQLSKIFFQEELSKYFFPEGIKILKDHQNKNQEIILLSNAIEIIVKEVAKYLNVSDYICTKLEKKDGFYTGKILGDTTFGAKKADKIKKFLSEKNTSLKNIESWGYGDHLSDVFMLKLVKHPFVVNPNKKLTQIAKENNWEVLEFKR